ncbi:MAG: glycosyltransferase [Pyrinomonadaceae bacterium]
MISGRDFVLISSIEWDFLWQSHQEIAERLARAGNRVLYIENTGVRAPRLSDAGRIATRLGRWARAAISHGVRQVAPNLYVCSPLVMPPLGRRWQRISNRRFLLPFIARAARRLHMRDPILWTFLPTDTASDIINLLRTPSSVVIYHCLADFSLLASEPHRLVHNEEQLLQLCDLVLAPSEILAARCSEWARNVHLFPHAVNLDVFPQEREFNGESQHELMLQALPRPVIGYVGGLHRHVDVILLEAIARARPRWSWVCVGPSQTRTGRLNRLPNVYLLGRRPHQELPAYIGSFDVCIVPYANSPITETIVPTKLQEYLAMGKPVVSTPLPAVRQISLQHEVVIIADDHPENFVGAIERALSLGAKATTKLRCQEVAASNGWRERLHTACELIEQEIRAKARLPLAL